jgi:hypothetical protein
MNAIAHGSEVVQAIAAMTIEEAEPPTDPSASSRGGRGGRRGRGARGRGAARGGAVAGDLGEPLMRAGTRSRKQVAPH